MWLYLEIYSQTDIFRYTLYGVKINARMSAVEGWTTEETLGMVATTL